MPGGIQSMPSSLRYGVLPVNLRTRIPRLLITKNIILKSKVKLKKGTLKLGSAEPGSTFSGLGFDWPVGQFKQSYW